MATAPSAPNTRSTQGTGFTNYDDILNANQTSGQGLGDAVGSGLESQANAVNSSINNATNQFNTGLTNANSQWTNSGGTGLYDLAGQLASKATNQDWSGLAQSPDVSGTAFNSYNYNGPSGLSNALNLTSQAHNASVAGAQAGTVQGQEALLKQDVAGNNNYTQGDSAFDQALLNKYGNAQVNQGRQALSNVDTNAQNAITQATGQAQNAQNTITAQKADVNKQLNSAESNLNNIGTAATNQNSQYQSDLSALASALSQGKGISSLTAQQQTDLQTIAPNISQYVQGAGTNNIDTSSPQAAMTALSQILSQQNAQVGGPTFTNDQYNAYNNLNSFLGNPNTAPANPSTYAPIINPNYTTDLQSIANTDANAKASNQSKLATANGLVSGLGQMSNSVQGINSIINQIGALQGGGTDPTLTQAYNDANDLKGALRSSNSTLPANNPTLLKVQSDLQNLQNYYAQQQQNTNSGIASGTMSVANYLNSLINPKAAPPAPKVV